MNWINDDEPFGCGLRLSVIAVFLAGGLWTTPSRAQPTASEQNGLVDATSEFVQDYLSDPRRVGSLAGSIIGGALTAHPAGPIVGGVVGFFVGKQTMFEDRKPSSAPVDVARRDIVPQGAGQQVATLSFAEPTGVAFAPPAQEVHQAVPPVATARPVTPAGQAVLVGPSQVSSIAPAVSEVASSSSPFGPARELPPGLSREQIASLCEGRSGGVSDPRLRGLCFYYRAN